jgi:hypothetical protein
MVELIKGEPENERTEGVDILYMYQALDGPREDVPPFVTVMFFNLIRFTFKEITYGECKRSFNQEEA